MALVLSFTAVETNDKTAMILSDTTGTYDAVTNPGGWSGGGNPDKTDIITGIATILLPDPDTLMPGTTPVIVDIFTTKNYPVTSPISILYTTDMGQTGTFPDGAYEIEVALATFIGGIVQIYTATWTAIFRRSAICCVDANVAITPPCDCHDKSKIYELLQAKLNLYAIGLAEACQNIIAGVNALNDVIDYCDKSSCRHCDC